MRHAVQQGNRLVRIHGDQYVASVRIDVIIHKPSVEKAQQRSLVKAIQLRRVLETYTIQGKSASKKNNYHVGKKRQETLMRVSEA